MKCGVLLFQPSIHLNREDLPPVRSSFSTYLEEENWEKKKGEKQNNAAVSEERRRGEKDEGGGKVGDRVGNGPV